MAEKLSPSAGKSSVKPAVRTTDRNLSQFTGYNMKRAFLLVQEDMAKTLAPLGLRMMTFSALAVIVENPDMTQTQLSQALGIERSGVVTLVDELEQADLISRNKVEGDRRSYALRETVKGRRLWQKAEAQVQAHEKAIFSVLSDAEYATLHDALRRVVRAARSE